MDKTKEQLIEENRILKRNKKITQWIQIIGTLIILIILVYGIVKITNDKYNALEPFNKTDDKVNNEEIKCIAENSVLLSTRTCQYCKKQKEILGDNIDNFKIIHCEDDTSKCLEIKSVPTWKIKEEYYKGLKTLDELKVLTKC